MHAAAPEMRIACRFFALAAAGTRAAANDTAISG